MILINRISELKKYMTVEKSETKNFLIEFYEDNILQDVSFADNMFLDGFSIFEDEVNLDKIANTVVKIKANTINAGNFSSDYIYAKKIYCKDLQVTYNLECNDVIADNIESLNIKAKNIKTKKILSTYIECDSLECDNADFYELNAKKVIANEIKGIKLNCGDLKVENINVKNNN